jgi:hypothetical protein
VWGETNDEMNVDEIEVWRSEEKKNENLAFIFSVRGKFYDINFLIRLVISWNEILDLNFRRQTSVAFERLRAQLE